MRPFETVDEKLRDIASCETMPKSLSFSNGQENMKSRHTSHATSTILARAIVPPHRFAEDFGGGIFASSIFEHPEGRKRPCQNTIDIENLS